VICYLTTVAPVQWVPGALSLGWSWLLTITWCRGQRMRGAVLPLFQYAFMA